LALLVIRTALLSDKPTVFGLALYAADLELVDSITGATDDVACLFRLHRGVRCLRRLSGFEWSGSRAASCCWIWLSAYASSSVVFMARY